MKAFFLIFLLLSLSLFPSPSPNPWVEIVEEELVLHTQTVGPVKLVPLANSPIVHDFPELVILSPQSTPRPELQPPQVLPSLIG